MLGAAWLVMPPLYLGVWHSGFIANEGLNQTHGFPFARKATSGEFFTGIILFFLRLPHWSWWSGRTTRRLFNLPCDA